MLSLKPARQSLANWLNRLLKVGLLSLLLGLAACGSPQRQSADLQPAPTAPPLASVQPSSGAAASPDAAPPSPELIAAVKARVSQEFGVAESQLQVQESQAVDWSDSCLGAAEAGELCAQMITPGYRIVLSSGTQQFEVHTDRTGRSIRLVR